MTGMLVGGNVVVLLQFRVALGKALENGANTTYQMRVEERQNGNRDDEDAGDKCPRNQAFQHFSHFWQNMFQRKLVPLDRD